MQAGNLAEKWAELADFATLQFICDEDDPALSLYAPLLPVIVEPMGGVGPILNKVGPQLASHCDVIGFLGDDHRPRTPGWDTALCGELTQPGVAYGNDLHQGPNIPTAVLITAKVITELGYMSPPGCGHLYLDNFWRTLGEGLGWLRYREDVIIEHMHPHAGKAPLDEGYERVNSAQQYSADGLAYDMFLANQWQQDLARLRENL